MRCQFYHAIVLCALIAPACGRQTADTPAPPAKAASAPAPTGAAGAGPATPTSENIRLGKELIERVRAAAGGAKLTSMRSIEATGVSTMSVLAGARALKVRAMFPASYRQEEIPSGKGGFGVAIGMAEDGAGWMLGGRLGGAGRQSDPKIIQAAYDLAASQAMAAFLAGVNAPWLVDSGKFTPMSSGTVESGDDRHLFIVNLEGPLGRAGRLLIDPGTNLPRRFIEPPQKEAGGEAGRNELIFTYADYRDVDGVQLPHTITRHIGRIQTTWVIGKYTINAKIRPIEFTRRFAATVK